MTRVESLKNFQEGFPTCQGMGKTGRELAIVGLLEEIAGSLAVIADTMTEEKEGDSDGGNQT